MRKNTKKFMKAPTITVFALELLTVFLIFLALGIMRTGHIVLVLVGGIYLAAAVGMAVCALLALRKRRRELDSGEEEEAKKY